MPVTIIRRAPGAATANNLDTARDWPTAAADRHNEWPRTSAAIARPANDNEASSKLEKRYSLHELAAHWNISLSTLYREIADGKLMAKKVRGQWRVSESAATAYSQVDDKPLALPGHKKPNAS